MDTAVMTRSTSARQRVVLAGAAALVGLAWVPLGLLHPAGEDALAGQTTMWITVHWAQLVLTPLTGLVMWRLLALPGTAAMIARIAVLFWVGLLGALGASAGVTTGLLVDGGFASAAGHLWEHVTSGAVLPIAIGAHLAWVTAVAGAVISLRVHGAPPMAWGSMAVAALLMATGHGDMFSSLGGLALAIAAFVSLRGADQPT